MIYVCTSEFTYREGELIIVSRNGAGGGDDLRPVPVCYQVFSRVAMSKRRKKEGKICSHLEVSLRGGAGYVRICAVLNHLGGASLSEMSDRRRQRGDAVEDSETAWSGRNRRTAGRQCCEGGQRRDPCWIHVCSPWNVP